jgi:hypothetical protein
MIKRGLSVFDPPDDVLDASGITPQLSEGERVLWIGVPGWLSSFFCTASIVTAGGLILALVAYHGVYSLTPEQYAIEGLVRRRWTVVGGLVLFALIPQLIGLWVGGAFVYILTARRLIVKIDRTRLLVRLFRYFQNIVEADGFAAYDLRYLNGARVYAGLWGYGNVSVRNNVGSFGDLRGDLRKYDSKPVFVRDCRFVKVFHSPLTCFHLAETFCNVYFGIKNVSRLGDVLNDLCVARLEQISFGNVSGEKPQ